MASEKSTVPQVLSPKGELIPLEHSKVTGIIYKALKAAENPDQLLALNLADKVLQRLTLCKGTIMPVSVEEVHNMTEFVLFETGNYRAAREFIIERSQGQMLEMSNMG
jgi:hypothetical protein